MRSPTGLLQQQPVKDMQTTVSSANSRSKVLVLGSGNFGSCLADHLADSEHEIILWSRSTEVVESMNTSHKNPKYLTDHVFPSTILAIGPELPGPKLLGELDVVLFAIPTQGLRPILAEIQGRFEKEKPLFIFVNKGIEMGTQALTLEIIVDTCGQTVAKEATFISGPSFAKEIVKRQPTTVSVASLSNVHAEKAAALFHQPWFRCYTLGDPIGVELAGALKNVYAIGAGIAAGLGYENNTGAGLITRSLAEMTRIGNAYGASPMTFLSLAGVGDLFLTCSSPNSRNYTVGYRLGKGERLEHILETLGSVAEGVPTTKGVKAIVDRLGVYAPIVNGVYSVLYENLSATSMAHWLMTQPPLPEHDFPARGGPVEELLVKLSM